MSPSRRSHDGLRLCARYALPTTDRRFCGPDAAPDALRSFLLGDGEAEAAIKALRSFEALYPYLEVLAEASGLDPFDEEVVEAYWLGNRILEADWRNLYPRLIRTLSGRGLPRSFSERLVENLPEGAIPHHTFHVLFVGVGAVTGHVPTTLPNMDSCRVSWGAVVGVEGSLLRVSRRPLEWTGGAFSLGQPVEGEVDRDNRLLPGLSKGDYVAIHWDTAVDRLTESKQGNLWRWTDAALKAANEAARRGHTSPE